MRTRVAAIPLVIVASSVTPWWTCGLYDPSLGPRDSRLARDHSPRPAWPPIEKTTTRDEVVPAVQHPPPPMPQGQPIAIEDQVTVRVLDSGRNAFLFCYHRAQREDPTLGASKISIHLYVDPTGAVMSAHTDVADQKLSNCLMNVAKRLKFPPPNALAVADLVFFAS